VELITRNAGQSTSTQRIFSPEGPYVFQIPYASTRIYAGQSLLHTEPNQTCFNYESFLICHGSLCNENWAPRNKEEGWSSQRITNRRGSCKHIYEALFQKRRVTINLFSFTTYLTILPIALKIQLRKAGLWVSSDFEIIFIQFRSNLKCARYIKYMEEKISYIYIDKA
jgi:hypothetical protein